MMNITAGVLIDKLIAVDLIGSSTKIIIRDEEFNTLAEGYLSDDSITMYREHEADGFVWEKEEDRVFIDITSGTDN